ncbi:MAG: HlyC/CorC family transporter [Proteobacteria bacterium]|nr:HlyC/CorC family transporter [Pseudomonadota bacterium]NDC24012.1 HlyC/CorC family transporter [Pseudomonadota bacterium]NDD04541.1 HlyC/CorC family transporter [Pseudomonadota bacterium]NDG26404.1 HlyC/CorC family transporter [Pseudomonadota bacterium]
MVIHIYLVLIPLLLFLAAVFAAAEASLFSLSQTQLDSLRDSRPGTYRAIHSLIRRPEELLSTVIVGNEVLSVLVGTFVVSLLEFYFGGTDETLMSLFSVLISTLLLLIFSEILPKILAFRIPVIIASVLVYPATWLHLALTPLRSVLQATAKSIIRFFRININPPSAITEKEFLTLVEVGAETGTLEREETEMIYNVFHLSDLAVSSVMTPWSKVFQIESTLSIPDILNRVRSHTFSRIPVVSGSDKHLVGILYTKELLKLLVNSPEEKQGDILSQAIFPPYYVSTHKKISKLFRELKTKKIHIAIVVDEYGKHLGVVTLEDVLNALFRTQNKTSEGVV